MIAITGKAAVDKNTLALNIGGKSVQVDIAMDDTATAIAEKVKAKTNDFAGYTITNDEGVVTVTADNAGAGEVDATLTLTTADSAITIGTPTKTPGTDKVDATPATAEFTVTAGNVAGTVELTVNGTKISVPVEANEKAADIALAIVNKVNATNEVKAAVTATNDGGKVTITNNTAGITELKVTDLTFTATTK